MIFIDPNDVRSPRDFVEGVEVILNEGEESVSVAKVNWEGNEVIGIRWNVARREFDNEDKVNEITECVGMPVSRGYPVWFILPDHLFDTSSELFQKIQEAIASRK